MDLTKEDIEATQQQYVRINPAGDEAKELRKWEQFPTYYTGPRGPGNPYRYRPFPKMLYRAERRDNGKIMCMEPLPHPHEFRGAFHASEDLRVATEAAERFNVSCQHIVNDEAEYQRAHENGWRENPADAVAFLEGREKQAGNAAAERNYADRLMGENAKAEAAIAEAAAGPLHIGEIAEKPIRRRVGRPRKVKAESVSD